MVDAEIKVSRQDKRAMTLTFISVGKSVSSSCLISCMMTCLSGLKVGVQQSQNDRTYHWKPHSLGNSAPSWICCDVLANLNYTFFF